MPRSRSAPDRDGGAMIRIMRIPILLALLLMADARPAAACSLIGVYTVRPPEWSHLIAVPSGQMVSAGRGLPTHLRRAERRRDPEEGLYSPRNGPWWRLQARKVGRRVREAFRPALPYGQVVRLERAGGADSARVRAALARSRGEAVLVRWDLGASCNPVRSELRTPWLRPGTRTFITAQLRPRRGWVRGRPTFDVQAHNYPYPFHALSGRGIPVEPGKLPVETFWSLYALLPPTTYQVRDTAAVFRPLDAWERANPAAARHPDARTLLDGVRRDVRSQMAR
jgi:hypothetical protein